MNLIILSRGKHRGRHTWLATYSGPHAASILDLFGTDILPTAFGSDTSAAVVIDYIQSQNPNVTVTT